MYLAYFGLASPARYGVDAIALNGVAQNKPPLIEPLRPGIYCISASILQSVYTATLGPWSKPREAAYQDLLRSMQFFWEKTQGGARVNELFVQLDRQSAQSWQARLIAFDDRRLERLCAYLRHRNPDANIGGSILVFNLSAEALSEALDPARLPAEMVERDVADVEFEEFLRKNPWTAQGKPGANPADKSP